ncbi:MAG: metal-dependent hydrolase [Candidatus Odinarchaeota archaeon]
MKGYFHGLITLIYGIAIVLPFLALDAIGLNGFIPPLLAIWFILMVSWGSLVPDVDASDSRFFHESPYISKFFKYAIYYPVAWRMGGKKHRGIMHTLDGLGMTVIYFTAIVAAVTLASLLTGMAFLPSATESLLETLASFEKVNIDLIYLFFFIAFTAAGLAFGIFGHLLEDSLTVSGIKWRFKSENVMKGPLRVGGWNEDLVAFTWAGTGAILVLVEFLAATEETLVGMAFSLVAVAIFLGTPFIVRLNIFRRMFGEDELVIDVKARQKAKKEAFNFSFNGNDYKVEPGRVRRGLKLVEEADTGEMKVGRYLIRENGQGKLGCNCKDYQKLAEYTVCKHVIAYIVKNEPKMKSELTKRMKK